MLVITQKFKRLLVLTSVVIVLVTGVITSFPVTVHAGTPAGCGTAAGPPTPGVTCPTSSTCTLNNGTCASCYKDQKNCIDCTNGKCSDPATTCNSKRCDLIENYVNPFINLFSGIVGLVITISLIAGGILYASSGGDPQKAATAKSRISKTIIAFFLYAFFYAFLQFLIPGGAFK